ncbi:GTP-binding protein [Campylobacter fetus]|nr:GTP-binding protein [Campylobacter fetus]
MLKEFIKEYKRLYDTSFNPGFKGEFEKFYKLLTEPKFHPSGFLFDRLNFLNSLNYEPPIVAVVGQFSSGKSSFLNALLGSDILPTGVVPVTAKPTYIKYAPNLMLKAVFFDGRQEYHSIDELGAFVDQRVSLKDVKCLNIYAPNEILKKVSFIDTPGLNSRSDADTYETKQILKEAVALIWISLIDNAARKSELDELSLIPNSLKQNAICLLNQKDKLSSSEIQNVLTHSKTTYENYFSDILPVSAKMQKEGAKDSGFEQIFKFIDRLNENKEQFIISECSKILGSSRAQNEKFIAILGELGDIFDEFCTSCDSKLRILEKEYLDKFGLFFETIKQNAALIASEINSCLKSEKKSYFRHKNGIFNKDSYEKIQYERVMLQGDEVLSKLIYNDDKLNKVFKKFKRDLSEFQSRIIADLSAVFDELKDKVLAYKAKYESLRKSDPLHSDVLFADIRKFSSEVYALFLNEFEKSLFDKYAKLGLFFERVFIKVTQNYQNAVKLSVSFIEQKCQKASDDYESDPFAFSLYYPQLSEINERLLTNLSYYEFENDFIGNSTFISKFINELNSNFKDIKNENLKYISALKERYALNLKELETKFYI